MVDITHKTETLRKAIAQATVKVSKLETIQAIVNNEIPKGNVFEMAKTAGLFAVKRTSDVIPDCHPLPIEFTKITYDIRELEIDIFMEVHTIYKTGVEVEAMHGVAIVALTMYDMLKPVDKGIEISNIKLVSKTGGKSDAKQLNEIILSAAIIVCSDSISKGENQDKSGEEIRAILEKNKFNIFSLTVVPDEISMIQEQVKELVKNKVNLIILTGGTGLSKRDVTPEAISPLIDCEIPGIMELTRSYGQKRTPFAMLSRGVAGMIERTLVITLPGSVNGVKESLSPLLPHIKHIFKVLEGERHD
jgi:molybdenum cofactor biosynthesis protein MoaC